jgi:maltokinase
METGGPSTTDLEQFLGHQRWFAGKGRSWRVDSVTTLGWLRTELPAVRLTLVRVAYDDGGTETYQLPLVHRTETPEHLTHALVGEVEDGSGQHAFAFDALHDKEVTGLWLSGIERSSAGNGWAFHRDDTAPALPDPGPSIVIAAEQSNTSLVFGDGVILKCFRKVSPGLNPDIEIHSALARAGSTHIAAPLGWLEGSWTDPDTGERATGSLAMAQQFLHNSTEGWELAKTSVRDLYAEADLHADEVGGDFAGEAHRLGVATAEVHRDLAAVLPTGTLDAKQLATLAEEMRDRLEHTAGEVAELAPFVAALRATYEELTAMAEPVPVQRIHGDFHLGQTMRTLDGWKLLDFEGEPARPLAERRGLDSPVKDVAGMLRSFDYAARHLLADHPADVQREYRAAEWADRNRDAFCAGYAQVAGRDPRTDSVLLRAFETDKAVYEVLYEARNRPTWLPVPLSAIQRLAASTHD